MDEFQLFRLGHGFYSSLLPEAISNEMIPNHPRNEEKITVKSVKFPQNKGNDICKNISQREFIPGRLGSSQADGGQKSRRVYALKK